MRLRIGLACVGLGFSLLPSPGAAQQCVGGKWIPGRNCVCPDGSAGQTTDLVVFRCPPSSRVKNRNNAAPAVARRSRPSQTDAARKAKEDKERAEAKKEEERLKAMLKNAEKAKKSAERSMEQANKRADKLQAKADATNDPQEKLSLLKQQLEIKKTMLPVARQRDKMQKTISGLKGQLEQASAKVNAYGQGKGAGPRYTQGKGHGPTFKQGKGQGLAYTQGPAYGQGKAYGQGPAYGQRKIGQQGQTPGKRQASTTAPSNSAKVREPRSNLAARSKPSANQYKAPRRVARTKTPVQKDLERELLRDYQYGGKTMKTIAAHADYATLASAAYKPDKQDLGIPGWKRLYKLPYKAHDKTGSNVASVYRSDGGKIVVAFQGTNEGKDWRTNLSVTRLSDTGQIDWARNTAQAITRKYGRDVTFVGHSLGGRLAQVARIETGANAVVFDTAPLSAKELLQQRSRTNLGSLKAFRSPTDRVSQLAITKDHIDVKNYNSVAGAAVHNHSHEVLADAMQTVKNACTWIRCK